MPRLGPLDLPLEVLDPARHAVKLTDPVVLLNGVSQDGQERSDLRARFPLSVRVRRGGPRVVAVVLEVIRIAGAQDRSGLVVVGKGRKRQRDAVLAPRGRPEVAADVLGQEREGLVEPLDPPDVAEGQLLREVVWTAEWTSSTSPPGRAFMNRRKSSTTSSGSSGRRENHGFSPNSSTKRGSRRRILDCQAGQSRVAGFRTTEKRNQPLSSSTCLRSSRS